MDRVHQEMVQMELARQQKDQMEQSHRQQMYVIIGTAATAVGIMIWLTRR